MIKFFVMDYSEVNGKALTTEQLYERLENTINNYSRYLKPVSVQLSNKYHPTIATVVYEEDK